MLLEERKDFGDMKVKLYIIIARETSISLSLNAAWLIFIILFISPILFLVYFLKYNLYQIPLNYRLKIPVIFPVLINKDLIS